MPLSGFERPNFLRSYRNLDETGMSELLPCLIFIDKEGRWYHKGAEMIHREFIRLFYKHMELDPQGRYVINWQGQHCQLPVEIRGKTK